MITLLEIIRRSESYLLDKGIERPRREAEEVIADCLGLKRLDLYLQFDRPLTESELDKMRVALQRRAKHEPAAYIAGMVNFCDLTFRVNESVLIPRPETEILVEKITTQLSSISLENKVLWDLCCGSGCIGLSLKKRFPELTVYLADISEAALGVAKSNCHNLDVHFLQGDLFHPFKGMGCDFLVCNPPYITEGDYQTLSAEVQKEPKIALVSGPTGYEFYERIALELKNYLRPDGLAWFELGAGQGSYIQSFFQDHGWNARYEVDFAGHDRFLTINF